jgi:hypothetical protein
LEVNVDKGVYLIEDSDKVSDEVKSGGEKAKWSIEYLA